MGREMTDAPSLSPDAAPDFDEEGYLRLYPDIAAAVASGKRESGLEHWLRYGKAEGRHYVGRRDRWTEVRIGPSAGFAAKPPGAPKHAIEVVRLSEDGRLFITGWVDDRASPLAWLRVEGPGWSMRVPAEALSRTRRDDVQAALSHQERHAFGFFALLSAGTGLAASAECRCVLEWEGGHQAAVTAPVRPTTARELLEIVLGFVTAAASGGAQIPAMLTLDAMAGDQIVALNRAVTSKIVAAPIIERFGPLMRRCEGSIVVCLYGKPEYMFVQNALFSGKPGIGDYEFIYVCNSPELLERLLKEARSSAMIYGLAQTVVGLPANAGFAAANNLAVRIARGRRIVFVNPDVFPKEPDWAARHTAIVDAGGAGARLFGATLYYDDGSLMHGGMYLELDTGIAIRSATVEARRFARVEHYGKGAPPDTAGFLRPRPVPAVSGAFLSVDRTWFEKLGGFSEDYVFGHYEDADFCLRSLDAGTPAWVQGLRLWHLEGRGSVRRPVHEGANVVNRWLFSRNWADRIAADLCGPAPRCEALTASRLATADQTAPLTPAGVA
jgi:GT2 family glycosyltransferase